MAYQHDAACNTLDNCEMVACADIVQENADAPDNVILSIKRRGSAEWESIDCGNENLHGPGYIKHAIADLVDAIKTGSEPGLSANKTLNATEIIFAGYEFSRRRKGYVTQDYG